MDRRNFLKLGAFSALAGAGFGSLMARAAGTDYKAAVCVFLAGGCDSNNLLIPNDDSGYASYLSARQRIAIPRPQLLPVLPISGGAYGFHPAMTGLQGLFNQGKLALLANVGTLIRPTTKAQANLGSWPLPDNLLSHIDQQNQWSMLNPALPSVLTGWGGRMADVLQSKNTGARFPTVVSAAGSNLFCDGAISASTAVDPTGANGFTGVTNSAADNIRLTALTQILKDNADLQLETAYAGTLSSTIAQADIVGSAFNVSLSTPFPQTDIGQQLYRIAQLIASRNTFGLSRQVFYVEMGGFDTHAGQLETQQNLLSDLSQALTAFYAATTELGLAQNVVTFTHSEFSRTFKPAGDNSAGTDHAWGGHSMILGGAVKGKDIYGTFPQLTLAGPDDISDEGRWIPTTSVDQYAATIASWMGVADIDLPAVLPNLANFPQKVLRFL
ncbi:DUF1501 domain-containing protein [Undibacterium sp. Jales W-56]|uniref:DUF1501 domain-containing protein n=1 Tax=Undibacterium sp. Jales W-56 TaxID=2897325 RepID=UPI0021D0E60A|nr:DUF1501 domain-containing protein [Undibacterium sp. Jales W-56]MCU6434103.1 DUF1501 domain-containing protein [Undibacterium sp. Jales W-56]